MSDIKDFVIKDGVLKKYTGNDAKITIPNCVSKIGFNAISNCNELLEVVIPGNVKIIDQFAFSECPKLKSVILNEGLEGIWYCGFYKCENLKEITIPDGVDWSDSSFGDKVKVNFSSPFCIQNGVLKNYYGSSPIVIIPEGVSSIDSEAFRMGRNIITEIHFPGTLSTIPYAPLSLLCGYKDKLKKVVFNAPDIVFEAGVFHNSKSLEEVIFYSKKVHFNTSVFKNCVNLRQINLPSDISGLEDSVFTGCKALCDSNGFLIINGYLINSPNNSEVVIPDGVTHICSESLIGGVENSFKYQTSLYHTCHRYNKVLLPDSIISISEDAFFLYDGSWGDRYSAKKSDVMRNSLPLKMNIPKNFIKNSVSLPAVLLENVWYNELSNDDWVYLITTQKDKKIIDLCEKKGKDILEKIMDDILAILENDAPNIAYSNVVNLVENNYRKISKDQLKRLYDILTTKKLKNATKIADLLSSNIDIPVENFFANHAAIPFSPELDSVKGGVRYKKYSCNCSSDVIKMMLQEYLPIWHSNKRESYGEMSNTYNLGAISVLKKPLLAEKIAAVLDSNSLSDFLETLVYGTNYRYFCVPYARFASKTSIEKCVKEISNRKKGHAKERYWAYNLLEALYYSDTKEAADYIEKYGELERYVRMRGMSVQEYRDSYSLPDFGFDETGSQKHTVDGKEIEFRITNSFDLAIVETESGKVLKSIAKKTGDGMKVANDYAALRKEIKDFYKKRVEYMKKTYITAEQISENLWKKTYISNPLFRPIVESLIWIDTDKVLFEVCSGECKDINGKPYAPVGKVAAAHVLDMSQEQIEEWQNHLITNKKSLLIEQVWEPIVKIENVMAISARYDGIIVTKQDRNELKKVMKSKGIDVRSEASAAEYDHRAMRYVFDPNGTMLIGDDLRMDYVVDEASGNTTLGKFSSFKWSNVSKRELNTVIFEFDRITLKSFIAKDDVSRLTDTILSYFTVAQLSEFIDYSTKGNSTNCTARLLDYKNTHFGEVDAFDMFVLE